MQKKIILFVILSALLVLGSCGTLYAWTYTDWVDYLGQLRVRDDVSSTWKNKINTFFQYESLFADQLSGYTNFYFNMDYGGAEVFATNNTINVTRVNQAAGYAPIQFNTVRWEDFYISSGRLIHNYSNMSYLNAYPGLIEVAEEYEALFNERMWFQNKYDLGFTFDPVGVTEVNYNGYQGLNAKKVNSNLITLGTLTKPSEKYKYYRFKLFDENGSLVGWLNYNTDNDYYSSDNIDGFLNPLTIYIQRRLIYLQKVYTLVIYAGDEPFNNDDTNVDDSQIETYIFLPENSTISGGTITNTGSGDNYTNQDSTNDIINEINNMENDVTNTITDGSQVDNIMHDFLGSGDSSGDIENIAGSLGFTAFDNPFTSFLFFVIDGVYDVLTEREDIDLSTRYKSLTFSLSSTDFITPQSELKTFIRNMLICVYIYGNYKYFHYMITLLETARINKFMAEIGTDEFYDTDIM